MTLPLARLATDAKHANDGVPLHAENSDRAIGAAGDANIGILEGHADHLRALLG